MPSFDLIRSFGISVKAWRGHRGLSQEELAGRAGLHRTYVSDVERGTRNVSLESVEKLAGALDVPAATLLTTGGDAAVGTELVDILLVEDNRDDAELTARALKKARVTNRIHVVGDGAEALHFVFATGRYSHLRPIQRPQLILLDLDLPKISGTDVLRRIKSDQRTSSIPVIVLTASRQGRDAAAARQLGADAYIVKPVDFQNLSEVTARLSLEWALLKPAASPAQE